MTSDVHFDRAALDAAARFCDRQGEEGKAHADTIRRMVICYDALSDRFLEQTTELRASASRMREIAAS